MDEITTSKDLERMQSGKHESSREWIRFGGKSLLRSSKFENDDEKHHHELLRYSGMTILKVEPMMKRKERSWRKTFD